MNKGDTSMGYSIPRKILHDERGWFLKVMDGNEPGNTFPGEVYFTSAKPGESKGGHYHKVANEWFTLIQGEAVLHLRNTETNESTAITLNGNSPATVYVPAGVAHLFSNAGTQDFLLVAFTDLQYHPQDTIPFNF